jgi:hypothetical protein
MAIYHLEAKIISRGTGRSAVAAAAYQSGGTLYNDYDGITHDYAKKGGVLYSEILLPDSAPAEWADRQTLWNAVEEAEKTKDSRIARQLIVALPTELTMQEWLPMLREFVREQCVAKGMCADFAVHDTDGHNPHAHILLTVRPLDDNGKWQAKTQKEYLCRRADEEQGFTSTEFPQAKAEGWEKLYKYCDESGTAGWYTPTEAALHPTWERTSKQPKATKFGRQNPVCEAWNSEAQILVWREVWADCLNRALEQKQCPARVTHLSNAARGLDEQPTVHEGYVARNLEKQGLVADRCELNREIRADNKLLRELKAALQKLTRAAAYSVERIAQALETIRDKIVLAEYQLTVNSRRARGYRNTAESVRPVLAEIRTVGQQILARTAERKTAQTEKDACGLLHPVRLHQLTGQIAALGEEIEELREKKSMLLASLDCRSDADAKAVAERLKAIEQSITKLAAQRDKLTAQREDAVAEFESVHSEIRPENMPAVTDQRTNLRSSHDDAIAALLQKHYGGAYHNLDRINAASRADAAIGEQSGEVAIQAISREQEHQHPQAAEPSKHKQNKNYEMSR